MLLVRQVSYIFDMHGSYKDNIWTPTSDETKQNSYCSCPYQVQLVVNNLFLPWKRENVLKMQMISPNELLLWNKRHRVDELLHIMLNSIVPVLVGWKCFPYLLCCTGHGKNPKMIVRWDVNFDQQTKKSILHVKSNMGLNDKNSAFVNLSLTKTLRQVTHVLKKGTSLKSFKGVSKWEQQKNRKKNCKLIMSSPWSRIQL